MTEPTDQVKSLIDAASIFTAFGAFFEMLPAIAALFSIIWTGMRIIEMVSGKPISKLFVRDKSI